MPAGNPSEEYVAEAQRHFATTHWSIVLAAGQDPSPASQAALATLCETYWYPLYAHVRRRGYPADEAQDLIQGFFVELLEKELVQVADRQRGRFRSFLLASLDHFLAKAWRQTQAQKRGGGRRMLSLDFPAGEGRYQVEPAAALTADKLFERQWALALIERALAHLRDEFVQGGKQELFDELKSYLGGGEETVPYRQLAAKLGLSEGAVKVAVHRLRRRCRELVRAEIAQTVAGPQELEEELRDLFAAVST